MALFLYKALVLTRSLNHLIERPRTHNNIVERERSLTKAKSRLENYSRSMIVSESQIYSTSDLLKIQTKIQHCQ